MSRRDRRDHDRTLELAASAIDYSLTATQSAALDAHLVRKALKELNLKEVNLLLIENVGNIICPADFPLGSHKRIVVLSLTEGPYVVLKHPFSFMDADVVAINKVDLAKATGIDPSQFEKQLYGLKPAMKVVRTNCVKGKGIAEVAQALGL